MTTAIIDPDLSAALQLDIVQGSVADWVIQIVNRDSTYPAFAAGDTIAAQFYQGQTQTPLFAPATAWGNGGAGYATAQAQVSPTSLQTSTLEPNGDYELQLWWTSADTTRTACVKRCQVGVIASPGITTQTVIPYCQLKDMLLYAPWLTKVQQRDIDG